MEITLGVIQYYAREGYWHHIIESCQEELRRGPDPVLLFWKAFGVFSEGNPTEAIRDLGTISQRREASYAGCLAQIYYHKNCRLVDSEAVDFLKAQEHTLRTSAPDSSLILAGQFYSLIGNFKKAKEPLSEVLGRNSMNAQGLTAYAWSELLSPSGDLMTVEKVLTQVIEGSGDTVYSKLPEALMGKAKLLERKKNFTAALEVLNDLLVRAPKYLPGLIEKMKVFMMIGAWDEIVESAQRVMAVSNKHIEALRMWSFYSIAREASFDVALEKLKQLQAALRTKEPKNYKLYLEVAKPLARISGRKREIVEQTLAIVQEARRIKPDDCEVLVLLGEQFMYLEDYSAAARAFTDASSTDEANTAPMYKLILCKILQEDYLEASQQMEFLADVEGTTGKSAELAYLGSLLAWRRDSDKKDALRLLDDALSLHVAATKNLSPGMEFYSKLNPDFLLQLAKEYLQYFGLKCLPKTERPPHYLIRAAKLLETITKQIPGIIECHLLLAKAKFISNEFAASQKYISIALSLDPDCIDALILLSLISLHTAQYLSAGSALEQAMSRNFAIRENPMFMLVKGQIEMKQTQWDEALKTFQTAVNLPTQTKRQVRTFLTLSLEDRAMLHTSLALCYAQTGKLQEASRVMSDAIGEFAGTAAEITVVIANSELAVKKGDIKQSLNILKGITSESPNFKEAQTAMGEIYLEHMFNRRLYAKCYYDIVALDDSVENYLLLGEALMRIQEPEEAIKIYEKALRHKPDDLFLTRQIGRALVLTHEYQRAVQYYESAVRSDPRKSELLIDLAKLYIRLKDFQSANLVLDQLSKSGVNDLSSMRKVAQSYLLQGRVFLQMTRADDPLGLMPLPSAAKALESARNLQKEILSNSRDLAPEEIQTERDLCSEIHCELGMYYQNRENDLEKAKNCFTESLTYDEFKGKAILGLAKVSEMRGDSQACLQFCSRMLRIDPSNEEAASLTAELYLQQNNLQEALACYKRILENQSDQYKTLAKLLSTLQRAGKVNEFESLLNQAARNKGKNTSSGYFYCKGLFFRKLGKLREALEELNKSRNDAVYGEFSLENMIDIYLNPEEDIVWTTEKMNTESVASAEILAKELLSRDNSVKSNVILCLVNIAKGKRESIDSAMSKLSIILAGNAVYVPAIVASALGKSMGNKLQEAKPLLESLLQIPYQGEFAESFQKGWLMLAHIYLQNRQTAQANELLVKILKLNQSSAKAKEMLGTIKETESDFHIASQLYENAWKTAKTATVGYRLAFNYLKAKKYVQCISICRELLSLYPNYPKVKEDIFNKAVEAMRS